MKTPPLQQFLQTVYERFLPLQDGEVADYIPELARADGDQFGICIALADGRLFSVGDTEVLFTLQSLSKPFVYGLALEARGEMRVLERVGVEPTGDAFNSIVLDEVSQRPYNPMVNAGAIAVTDLIRGEDATDRLHTLLDGLKRFTGGDGLFVDMPTFTSERATGHRNRAIAHLMRGAGMIEGPIEETLDLYFQQCAALITVTDLATMAATLATGGIHPITGRRALAAKYIQHILSVMYTCGMYDSAGEWAYRVGLPAKSGVSGGIFGVLPGKAGIAVYSPRVDQHGNSVRGVAVFEMISREYGLHLFGDRGCDDIFLAAAESNF